METFFQLSVELQLAIGAGYLGYLTAYSGVRGHHQQIDVAFLTVAFGLVATVSASLISTDNEIWRIVGACASSVAAGLLWRKWGRRAVRFCLNAGRVAYADDDPTVLAAIAADTRHNVTQAIVVLTDGTELLCDDTAKFRDAAIAPFIYGADGSVAIYVTHTYRRSADNTVTETVRKNTRDQSWGDRLTILPATSIRSVELRFQKKS